MDQENIPLSNKREYIATKLKSIQTALAEKTMNYDRADYYIKRLSPNFDHYDKIICTMELLKSNDEEVVLAEEVRNQYHELNYEIQSQIRVNRDNIGALTSNISTSNIPGNNITGFEIQRLAKLPTATLPKFDGNFENWLSFKNTFKTLIDKRTDIDDTTKFLYLRSCLTGAAENKLSLYQASAENYTKAWDHLTDIYQKERALVFTHYDALLKSKSISVPNTDNLNKLIDDARQHLNDLISLKASPNEAFIVRILELKLPMELREKWSETFKDDNTLPTFSEFSNFINNTAFRLRTRTIEQRRDHHHSFKRKTTDRAGNHLSKLHRSELSARALVTVTSYKCPKCKDSHPLFKCQQFKDLTINQRINFAKANRLCKNCLRTHGGSCNSINCRTCNKFHHTMLHLPRYSTQQTTSSNTTSPSNPNPESNCTAITIQKPSS